ncbi:IS110 family transposase [Amphritea sp. 1_MG-2023]|uniref:IS110 family transposase n=1 Tax=Amphritea sp. 1_MG-2023 TaxID=3062670 RepID=UPI0026E457A6|nr:IS110 family transposase [Amphritea sp. 1_MG-2023]MDO6565414.1 IS110 family transposase [Amphritea sp. 1_MG-2023]
MYIKVLGIDLGKSSFHFMGRDAQDQQVCKKKLSRQKLITFIAQLPPCLIAFEAYGGAHWLGRLCLDHGHDVRLIPPQYVKPFVKGNKNDFIDALAITEAARRPDMRFVAVKSIESQSQLIVHRVREGFVADRTACMSRIGALSLEFGLSFPRGHSAMKRLLSWLSMQKVTLCPAIIGELQVMHDH